MSCMDSCDLAHLASLVPWFDRAPVVNLGSLYYILCCGMSFRLLHISVPWKGFRTDPLNGYSLFIPFWDPFESLFFSKPYSRPIPRLDTNLQTDLETRCKHLEDRNTKGLMECVLQGIKGNDLSSRYHNLYANFSSVEVPHDNSHSRERLKKAVMRSIPL